VYLPLALSWFGKKRRHLVDEQTSLESLRNTSWKDFEFLVAEAYRRQGFQVEYSLSRGADGGVDLILRKDGRGFARSMQTMEGVSVGAPVIRQMFGLLIASKPMKPSSSRLAHSPVMPKVLPRVNQSDWLTVRNCLSRPIRARPLQRSTNSS